MKRTWSIALFLLFCVLISGCTPTTYTDQPVDYLYSVGEEIHIRDKESHGELGTVTITDIIVIKDEPFELTEATGRDEDGDPIYKQVPYEALVQINYTYSVLDSTKGISDGNFSVKDAAGHPATVSPMTDYQKVKTEDSVLIAAVKKKGEYVTIGFSYHIMQKEIAFIKAYYDHDKATQPPETTQTTETQETTQETTQKTTQETQSSKPQTENKDTVQGAQSDKMQKMGAEIFLYRFIIFIQILIHMALIIALVVVIIAKRKDTPR